MKKKMIWLLLFLLMVSGCKSDYNADYLKQYKTYLSYAFGNYTVLKDERKTYDGSPIPVHGEYNEYEISYQTKDGQTYILSFSNREDFNWIILNHATMRSQEEVTAYFEKAFANYKESETLDIFYDLDVPVDKNGKSTYSKKMLSGRELFFFKGKGLSFTDFDIMTLKKYEIYFSFIINYDMYENQDYGNEEEFNEKLCVILNQLVELSQNEQIAVNLNIHRLDDSWVKYKGSYNKETMEYEIIPQ